MYIITPEYFKDKEEIPNVSESDSKASAELERFIDRFGRLFVQDHGLTELDQYLVNGLLPAVPASPTVDTVPVKWRNLVTGCSYVKNDVTLKWKGLIYELGSYKGSILVDYIFYHWLKDHNSYVTQLGEVKANVKGASQKNITETLYTTWNSFVKQNQHDLNFNYYFGNYWNGYTFDWNCESSNSEVSLLQFLDDNAEDYTGYISKHYEIKNQLGL